MVVVKSESKTPWEVKLVVKKEEDEQVVSVEKVGGSAKTPWEIEWVKKEIKEEPDEKKKPPSAAREKISAVRKAQRLASLKESEEDAVTGPPKDTKKHALRPWDLVKKEEYDNKDVDADATTRPVPPLASWEEAPHHAMSVEDRLLGRRRERLVCLKNYAAVDATGGGGGSPGAGGGVDDECKYGLIDRGPCKTGIRALVMHSKTKGVMDRVKPGTILYVQSTAKGGGVGPLRVRYTTPAKYYAPGTRVTTLSVGVDATDWHKLMSERRRI